MFKEIKSLSIFTSNSSFVQLLRTYLVGAFNLIFGLFLTFIFQFYILVFINFPLRTYTTNVLSFFIGVFVSYFISRKIIFKLRIFGGSSKEFYNFFLINLINLIVPNLIWFIINLFNERYQQDEVWFLIITVLIAGVILPIKYLFYKFFVFKDSL